MGQDREALPNGIRRGSLGAESIGVRIALRFRNGIESQQVQSLHGSILHRGNRKGAKASRTAVLRNVDAPKRLGSVTPVPQGCDGACFLLWRVPDDSVDTRCPFAIVARHSLDGNCFAAERVG
jgi:hypothetical protein